MLEQPDLDHAALVQHLRQGWGLVTQAISFLPAGYDATAWAYDVRDEPGRRYFVKVRTRPAAAAPALVPRLLRERGLGQAVAPVPTLDGQPWWAADGLQLGVYPYIDGTSAWRRGLTDGQWVGYGAFLGTLHRVDLPAELADRLPTETFVCAAIPETAALDERLGGGGFTDPWQRELAEQWHRRRDEIVELADRTGWLGALAQTQPLPAVLCHADIHLGNVLVDRAGALFVVDWDAPMLAPAEKDLVLVLSGMHGETAATAEQLALFWRGYGPHEVNPVALEFYRCARRLEDITAFAADVLRDGAGEATRRDDLSWFLMQFSP